jgi:hypothetical protein
MSHPSISKSKPTRTHKAVSLSPTVARNKATGDKAAVTPVKHGIKRGSGAPSEGRQAGQALPEQYWTLFMQAFLHRTKIQSKDKEDHLADVIQHESSGRVLYAGMGQIAAGAEMLTKRILAHAMPAPEGQTTAEWSADDFVHAYALIVQGVPADKRGPLLQDMRLGLEAVAKDLPSEETRHARAVSAEDAPMSTREFLANLEQQETAQRARDMEDGLLVPGTTLASRLRMTPQGLHHARKARRVFALQGPSGELVYPAFFSDPRQDRKILEAVSKALGDLPGAAKWDFFMSPRISLGNKTPLEALAKGKVDAVMAAAQAFTDE